MLRLDMKIRLVNQIKLPTKSITDLETEIPEQENLKDVMKWALSNPGEFVPQVVADVIVQDEFTHDVVVPWRDGLVLVYDTTWMGGITAVAVWDHLPSAAELLDARLQAGWNPRPSMLREGDRVVGHASCIVTKWNRQSEFNLRRIEQALGADSPWAGVIVKLRGRAAEAQR